MKFSIKLLILYQLVLNSALADIVTTPIRSMPPNPVRHNSGITSIAISPDGRYAISASWDNTMKLWELSSGTEIRRFAGHTSTVSSLAFSSNGSFALSGSHDNTMKLWDVSNGVEVHSFVGHSYSISSVAFSPDGRYVYSGSGDRTLKMWDSGIKPKGIGQAIIIAAGGAQKGNSLYQYSNEYTQRFYRITSRTKFRKTIHILPTRTRTT
jgi:WD40 repeat protein